ncbi:MAG: transglutaminase family protein [Burkholderiaceae bacterium]|nr:transglutaminase family protein [Burkholderiaceae bacterium]
MRLLVRSHVELECEDVCPTVAMLRPSSGDAQWVVSQSYEMAPWIRASEYTDSFGNVCQRFTLPEGISTIDVQSQVVVADDINDSEDDGFVLIDELPTDCLMYLLPSRYCPADAAIERAWEIVGKATPGFGQVMAISDWIRKNITYQYGVSNESTGAFETMEAKAGVCRDFSHVAITLCRALRIPARYVSGYLHKLDPMDMHAWFEAYVGGSWHTFDATQATREPGRVVVSYGRDAADVAFLSNYGPMKVNAMKVSVEKLLTAG